MARKKKGKGQRKAAKNALREDQEAVKAPHTFVVHRGHVGNNVGTLTMDMRQVMEPYTATNLKLRKKNVFKDLVAVAGPLGVTNFIMFSKTPHGTNMRIARLPRGPTLHFQVEKYSLCRDIVSALKKPQTFEGQFHHPPLLVLNNFKPNNGNGAKDKESTDRLVSCNPQKLCATMLQNMFPSINIHKVKLNHVKRCVSFSYAPETDLIEFRHYNISVKPLGMSHRMKKLLTRKDLPDLGKFDDISEYLVQKRGEGSASESEAELDGPHNEVELSQNVSGKGNLLHQQSAIRLTELGPRMTLKLIKAEEGLCDGAVLYHSIIEKSPEEISEALKKKEEKKQIKAKRKAQQESNVAKKKALKEEQRKKTLAGMKRKLEEAGEEDARVNDDDEDAEWYQKEVGEAPDPELFSSKSNIPKRSNPKKKKFAIKNSGQLKSARPKKKGKLNK